VRVEELPWAIGKHQLTKAYMLFLAHCGYTGDGGQAFQLMTDSGSSRSRTAFR
jgi:hypothetical protein